jgi:hypothetical protein
MMRNSTLVEIKLCQKLRKSIPRSGTRKKEAISAKPTFARLYRFSSVTSRVAQEKPFYHPRPITRSRVVFSSFMSSYYCKVYKNALKNSKLCFYPYTQGSFNIIIIILFEWHRATGAFSKKKNLPENCTKTKLKMF